MDLLHTVLVNALVAAVPAVGFALLFNVPVQALPYVACGGAIARGLRTLFVQGAGMSIELSTLLAVSLFGMLGVWWARRLNAHPKVFTVAAIIPMIPGVPAYTSLMAILEISHQGFTPELWGIAVENGLKTFLLVGAMSVGLAAPGLLLYRGKPIV
ncbi:MAG: threonine/serine exporter family protein [Chthoniobacterales bacterium]|nr:threonine/serine exporter family protein [Chthoniobacterales bacterium]